MNCIIKNENVPDMNRDGEKNWKDLQQYNPGLETGNPDLIRPGDKLIIPNANTPSIYDLDISPDQC